MAALGVAWIQIPRGSRSTLPQGIDSPPALASIDEMAESQTPRSEYVGPQACARCHAEIAADYQLTKHSRTCRTPVPSEMPPGFTPERGHFKTSYPGLRFELSQDSGKYLQTTVRETSTGDQRTTARIDLVYGAGGTADDVFLSWRDDDHMVELPMVWLYPMNKWSASHFDPNSSGDYSRALTVRCLECHNTWLEHVPGTANQYRRGGAILGVTCESCHGPGRKHVEFHDANPDADRGHEIVQPGLLNRDLQTDVCVQCHGNAINRRGPAFGYRPGEPLERYYRSLSTKHTEDDHVANQIQYLSESKCYQRSEHLTCVTCHNPHRPQAGDNAGASSCRQCHQPIDCRDRDNLPTAVQDDCVACHMRPYLKINVNFQTEDDNFVVPFRRYEHRIQVDPVARQEVLLNWYRKQTDAESQAATQRLAESLIKHWVSEADQRRKDFRYLGAIAALREAAHIDETPDVRARLKEAIAQQASLDDQWAQVFRNLKQEQHKEAIAALTKILSVKPDDSKAHGKLGTQYATIGQKQLAIEHLQAVGKYDPDDAYGEAMLGWLALLEGNLQQSLEHYLRADEKEPYEAKINYHLGLVLAALTRLPEATERFRKALAIEPEHLEACDCLILALRQQGKSLEAISVCRQAVRITKQRNLDVLVTMAETCADAGQLNEALEAATRAMRLAEAENPTRAPQVRQWLEALRNRAKTGR